ncbi:MAG: thiamine pyrophosphate-dependent enzyme, partial [Thermoplasmata archaeon]|nr:thiamine pyrophosphate-dependent enzyme [Thermoplasmata archaeon]
MADAGTVAAATESPPGEDLSAAELTKMYRAMALARVMDERCLTLQRQGRIGFYVPLQGQEAAQVACAWALDTEDWIFPAYRELAIALVRGVPLKLHFDQFIG